MRLGVLLLAACASSTAATTAQVYYPLHPRMRSASGGPISLVGEVARPGVIPYTPGITLTCALRLSGGPTAMAAVAFLNRGGRVFQVPVRRVVDHEAPDPELAPGDIVSLEPNVDED